MTNYDCDKLLAALQASDRLLPALIVEHEGCRGIAYLPGFNSSLGPQEGQIIVMWSDGEITTGDFIDTIIGDAWEAIS